MVAPEDALLRDPLFYVGAVMGIGGLVMGEMFRRGHLAQAARWYWDKDQPWYIRNLPFAWYPAGGFFLGTLAGLAVLQSAPDELAPLGWMLLLLGGLASILMFLFFYWPPRALKPEWLRERERTAAGRRSNTGPQVELWRAMDKAGFAALLLMALVFMTLVVVVAISA